MKKILSLFIIVLVFLLASAPSQAQNIATSSPKTTSNDSQLRKCLSYTTTGNNKVQLVGSDLPANQTVYIVDCVATANDFVCTTGNKSSDKILNISKTNTQAFSLVGSNNPVTVTKGGILKVDASADLTGGKIHIFSAVILENVSVAGSTNKAINFDKLNFYDQNLPDCQVDKSINNPEQTVVTSPSSSTPVTTVSYGVMNNNGKTFVIGKVSHPFAKIEFIQSGKVIASTSANKYGAYEASIDNKKIDQTAQIGVQYTKIGTNKQVMNFFTAHAQSALTASFMIDPIFSYIEGYAYDAAGKTLSNATVNIKLKNSDDIYYSATADERGFFSIAPQYLPIYAYEIEIKNPASKTVNKQLTHQFATKNKEYLAANKIDMVTATKNNKSLVKAAETSIPSNQLISPTVTQKQLTAVEDPNSIVFTLIVLFVIILVIGVTLYFLYKNNTHDKDDKHLF